MISKNSRGYILLTALVFMAIFLTGFASFINYMTLYTRSQRLAVADAQALALAEAGIEAAVYQLNQNGGYAGEANTALGAGQFTTQVTSIDSNTKRITSVAHVPDSANPIATRTVKASVNIDLSVVSFRYGVQVGTGGAVLGNGSVVNGNLYSGGSISGGGTITGDATVSGGTQPDADQSWTVQNSGFNLGDVSARANVAQSFVAGTSTTLNKVSLYVKKTGMPSDITIKVVSDNGGVPSKTVLASGSISASTIASAYGFVDAAFATPPSLSVGMTYWIIAIASVDANNYFTWGSDTNNGYVDGTGKYSSNWNAGNPSWNNVGADLDFKTFMGGDITSISGVTVNGNAWAHSLSNCTVGGNAMYQTITSCTVGGSSTQTSADAATAPMPITDAHIANWESIAENGGVIQGPYTIANNTTQTLGPTKINGDLTVNGTLYLSGPIWVNGDITFGVGSGLIVSISTGASGAILLADATGNTAVKGTIYLANNMTIAGNGNPGSYPMVLSTNTSSAAINMNNNATSVILYAANGGVTVSNNAQANQVSGQSLILNNNSTINYVNGLQSESFSNGPGGSWTFMPGSYVIQ